MQPRRQIGTYFNGKWWRTPFQSVVWLYKEFRDFYLRGMYGFAPPDLWSFDSYLASWMPEALRQMKRYSTDIEWEDTDLEKMARGFEIVREMDEWNDISEWEKLEKERLECMTHFINHFRALWW